MRLRISAPLAAITFLIAASPFTAQTYSPNIQPQLFYRPAPVVVFDGDFRYQHYDNTNVGTPKLIRGIAMHRYNCIDCSSPARTMDLWVRAAEVDMSRLHIEFDRNLDGSEQTVFAPRRVTLPDWSDSVNPLLEPFDFVMLFQPPFQYTGNGALLIDIQATNASTDLAALAGGLSYDSVVSEPDYLGVGCPRPNGGSLFSITIFENSGSNMPNYGMHHGTRLYNADPFNPVFLMIGVQPLVAQIPGMCAPLQVDPLALVELDPTNSEGFLEYNWNSFPYDSGLTGQTIYTQALQFTLGTAPGLPFELSNGVQNTMPFNADDGPEVASNMTSVGAASPGAVGQIRWGTSLLFEILE